MVIHVHIRELRKDNEDRVLEIIHESSRTSNTLDYPAEIIEYVIEHHYNRDWFREIVARKNRFVVIDDPNKMIVAIGGLKRNEIVNMFVAPNAQRKGVGSYLLEFLLRLAEFRGYGWVYLNSTITAKSFYLNHNFEVKFQQTDDILSHTVISYCMTLTFQ
jgi:GNAT superfamily N-acetyltransferase